MDSENEREQSAKTLASNVYLTDLCYVMMFTLVSTFKVCSECEAAMIKEATQVGALIEKETGEKVEVDTGVVRFGFIPMVNWGHDNIVAMRDAICSVAQQPFFCQSCKEVFLKALIVLEKGLKIVTENEKKEME